MIKLQQYSPDVYYRESRDFQFIGRLYDLVLNYVKTNVDLIYNLPFSDLSDDQFIDLLALTLGFKAKHRYTSKHLRAICSTFSEILRNKGTIKALLLACNALLHVEGIDTPVNYAFVDESGRSPSDENFKGNANLVLYLPPEITDTALLNDLLDYILPAGLGCSIVKTLSENRVTTTEVNIDASTVKVYTKDGSVKYNENILSEISSITDETKQALTQPLTKDTVGIIANSAVYKPEGD